MLPFSPLFDSAIAGLPRGITISFEAVGRLVLHTSIVTIDLESVPSAEDIPEVFETGALILYSC